MEKDKEATLLAEAALLGVYAARWTHYDAERGVLFTVHWCPYRQATTVEKCFTLDSRKLSDRMHRAMCEVFTPRTMDSVNDAE